jgi:hypothetical protein
MKHLVEFPLEDGNSIVVEIDESETGGTVRANRGDKIEKAKETLEEALDRVLPATKSIVEKLWSIVNKPDETEVTFGIKLSTVAGAVIASATAEANFNVTLRWKDKIKDPKDD